MAGMNSITIETLDLLLDKLPVKYAALVVIGVVSCARVSEILTLTRRDLIDENGNIRREIAIIKLKARRKHDVYRHFSIPQKYVKYIIEHLKREEKIGNDSQETPVFRGRNGLPMNRMSVYRFFRRVMGEGYGTHWMRKTGAQSLFKKLCELNPDDQVECLECLREFLGHERMESTIKYLGFKDGKIKKAFRELYGE